MADREPSRGELVALLRLQETESAIRVLERRLEELPEQAAFDAAAQRAADVKTTQDAHRVELDLVETDMRRLEGEIELLAERRDADQRRLYGGEISNPKELQAVRTEIEHIGERIEMLEDRLLEVLERREEIAGKVAALDERRDELTSEQDRLAGLRDAAAKEVLAERAELEVTRDKLRGEISPGLLDRYDTSKRRHGGVGVAAVESGICTACRMELTPLELSELRQGPPLSVCPQCQRFLVVVD